MSHVLGHPLQPVQYIVYGMTSPHLTNDFFDSTDFVIRGTGTGTANRQRKVERTIGPLHF